MEKEEINKMIDGLKFSRYLSKSCVNDLVENVRLEELEEGCLLELMQAYLKLDMVYDELIDFIKLRILKIND